MKTQLDSSRAIAHALFLLCVGSVAITLGTMLTLTLIGAIVGLPMMLIGFACFALMPCVVPLNRKPNEPPPLPKC